MKENCELLIRAKGIAAKRGLDSGKINCPVLPICSGEVCVYFAKPKVPNGEERFFSRLNKTISLINQADLA